MITTYVQCNSCKTKYHEEIQPCPVCTLKTEFAELQKIALPLIGENAKLREALDWIAADGFKGRMLKPNQEGFRDELIAKAREALK